ncbi:PRP39 pre-mRNA processing factor 39 [Sparganum proliferum]
MSSVDKLWRKVRANLGDFNAWISLLDAVEKHNDIEASRKAFDAFLDHFPYCYGYWKKYADLERHAGNKERCLEIYAKGVEAIPLSIDLWTAYLDATMEIVHGQEDYETRMRDLYELALEKAGLEFRSDALWEHYISWESGHNRLQRVLAIYDRILKTPTQLYFQNWDSFKKLIEENKPEEVLSSAEFVGLLARVAPVAATALRISMKAAQENWDSDGAEHPTTAPPKKSAIEQVTEPDRTAVRQFIIDSREKVYQATYLQIMKRWYFEEKIRRPYFHVKPLEEMQINNWAEYLSFEENEASTVISDFKAANPDADPLLDEDVRLARKRVRILYERCLVACALYENFWIRYAKYLEFTEMDIPAAREVWRRACTVHLRRKPTIHWYWAMFEDRYPANLDSVESVGKESAVTPAKTSLEILTDLEARLPDSALACARRVDAMRRAKKPLLDIIVCIRSGINRLRLRASEQANVAHNAAGPTASMTAALALAASAQARAGASYLAGKLSRLLHRNVNNLVPPQGIHTWQLLLSSAYKVEPEPENQDEEEGETEVKLSEPIKEEDGARSPCVKSDTEHEDGRNKEPSGSAEDAGEEDTEIVEMEGVTEKPEAEEELPVTPETISRVKGGESKTAEDDVEMETADSPPVVLVRTKSTCQQGGEEAEKVDESKEDSTAAVTEEKAAEGPAAKKRKRRSRWGSESDLLAAKAEEEKRLAQADADAKEYALERERIICVQPPSPESLTEEDKQLMTAEEAAIAILKEAIEYDPRNERLYAQLLDIAYQRRPVDLEGFLQFADFAIVDSLLPATVKLAFSQRKLQFLEEFGDDIRQLSIAYDEYASLAQLVCRCTSNRQTGVDATRAYSTPDLLNVVLPAPLRPSAKHNPAANGPVRKMPRLTTDISVLEDAASVGTPIAPPETAASFFTAGAYEPLAGAQGVAAGLPPPAPTMVPVAPPMGLHGLGTNGVVAATGDASAVATTDLWLSTAAAAGHPGGYYYAPVVSTEAAVAGTPAAATTAAVPIAAVSTVGLDFNLPAPPPAPPLNLNCVPTTTVAGK